MEKQHCVVTGLANLSVSGTNGRTDGQMDATVIANVKSTRLDCRGVDKAMWACPSRPI